MPGPIFLTVFANATNNVISLHKTGFTIFLGGGEAIRLHALHVAVKMESYLRPTDLARVTKVLFIFISSNGPSIL